MTNKVVVVVKTWQGPTSAIAKNRLAVLPKTLASLDKYLVYPDWSLHIADDGSAPDYLEALSEIMGDRPYSFSWSGANGDIGRNLNIALSHAFIETDVVLNWSDDILLHEEMDIEPYVDLLCQNEDIGVVVTRMGHPTLDTTEIERDELLWHRIENDSPNKFLFVTSLNLMHRRHWDYYGPYPEGLRIDIMQEEMAWRYRRFEPGLSFVIPDELIERARVSAPGKSTWDWRLADENEQAAWYRYRSYSERNRDDR